MRKFHFRKLKRWVKTVYHWMVPREESKPFVHTYDARELFFHETNPAGFNRYDMIVRLLAVENYYGQNNFGFALYEKQQNARRAEDWQNAVSRFKALIQSYEEHGYDDSSEILLGSDLHLWDGSHRMALAMYHHHYEISCKVMPTIWDVRYGLDWYVENDFTIDEINKIQDRYVRLKEEIAIPFICTLWAPVAPYFDEIVARLRLVTNVISYQDYSYDEYGYAQIVRKVYAVDDIEKWKIEKKLEYMRQNVTDGRWMVRVVKLQLDNPDFRCKDSNQNLLSRSCENIKRIIRNCYKDKLPNYFHDIICHIGDNFYQNMFIDKLFNVPQDVVSEVFEQLNKFEYSIVKYNTPSIPSDFPNSYTIGKDVDIVCTKENFEDILSVVEHSLDKSLSSDYSYRRAHSSDSRTLIRVELEGSLLYAFDIYYQIDDIVIAFFEELIKHRQPYNGVYVSAMSYELVLRLYEVMNSFQKAHHLYFVCQNIDSFDKELCDKYLSPKANEILEKIKSGELNTSDIVADKMSRGGGKKTDNESFLIKLAELSVVLYTLNIPKEAVCVVGSSIMAVKGIRNNHDVDFVMASRYRKRFDSTGVVPFSENVEMVSENWARSKHRRTITDDELISNPFYHFVYKGFKFATMELLLDRKEYQGRNKDLKDVELIKEYLNR